jgi:Glycosyltransferase family 87
MRSGGLKKALVVLSHVAVWAYSAVHFLNTGVTFALHNYSGDFLANFPAHTIVTWINRPDLFSGSLAEQWLPPPRWGYGPGMYLVTFPLLFLPSLPDIYRTWLFVNYGFLAAGCWLLYRLAFPGSLTLASVTMFGFLVLNYYPLYEALIQRNIEIFELLLIVAAMTLYARRRDALAGGLVGLAAMTKFLPGIFVPYFVLKGRWRAIWTAVVIIGLLGVLAQGTLGWEHNWVLIQLRQGSYLEYQLNQSVSGALLRLARSVGLHDYGIALSRAILVILAVALARVMWRFRSRGHWKLEWSVLIVAMIMLLPHNQNYYLVFLLIPYAVLLGMVKNGAIQRWESKALIVVSFVLTGWPIPLSLLDRALGQPAAELLLWLSVPVWGVGLLVVVLIKTLWETSARTLPQEGQGCS